MKPCVLIIDDDPSVGSAVKKVLGSSGYETVWAADGQAGVANLERQAWDLLVLDLDLPKISGWDILDLATARFPTVPVLILTAFSGQCVPGSLTGADALLEKPPDVNLLLKKVAELLAESPEKRLERRYASLAGAHGSKEGGYRRLSW